MNMNTQDNNPYASPQSTGGYSTNAEMYPVVSFWWWLGVMLLLALASYIFFPIALIIAIIAIFVTDNKTKRNFFIAYLLKFVILVPIVIAIFAIFAAVSLPAYKDYTSKAKVTESMAVAQLIKQEVEEAYLKGEPLSSIDTDSFANSKHINNVKIEENGTIVISVSRDIDAQARSFSLVPSLKDNQIHWKCVSSGLPNRLLPQQCRQAQ